MRTLGLARSGCATPSRRSPAVAGLVVLRSTSAATVKAGVRARASCPTGPRSPPWRGSAAAGGAFAERLGCLVASSVAVTPQGPGGRREQSHTLWSWCASSPTFSWKVGFPRRIRRCPWRLDLRASSPAFFWRVGFPRRVRRYPRPLDYKTFRLRQHMLWSLGDACFCVPSALDVTMLTPTCWQTKCASAC